MLIEAVGINPEASRLAGVRARTIIWTVYAFSGLCAGLAGLVIAPTPTRSTPTASACGSSSTRSSRSSSAARRWWAAASRWPAPSSARSSSRPCPHDPQHRDPLGGQLPLQGGRRDRRVPPPVAEGPRGLLRVRRPPPRRADPAPLAKAGSPHEHRHRPHRPRPGTGSGPSARPSATCRSSPPLALFLGLFGVGGMRYEGFADPQVLLSLLIDNAFLIVLGVGMTFVILTGGIDLSVGSVVALSTMIAAKTLRDGLAAVPRRSPRCSLTGTRPRAADGPAHPLLRHPAVHRHAGRAVPGPRPHYLISVESISIKRPHLHRAGVQDRSTSATTTSAWTAVIALVTVAVAAYVLARTRFGRTVYAIGGNESSAMLMGLRVAAPRSASTSSAASAPRWPDCCSPSTSSPATACTRSAWSSTPSPRSSSAARC